jgi:serine/threonine protein kinase
VARAVTYGKYELLQRINVGGMAEVFKARLAGSDQPDRFYAIKRILPSIAEDSDFINMFIDEAKLSLKLQHPNIAFTHEHGEANGTYYIAMEYIAGKDLRTVFERLRKQGKSVPPELAAYVVSRVAAGLDYAHTKKDEDGHSLDIVHRDISPQNVLLSFDGDVKIIDFGIAKAANKIQRTQVGILKGKFGYMSPEQVAGKEIDSRSDLFSLGVVLYEMLAGERLFVGANDHSVLDKVRSAEIPALSVVKKDLQPALERIVSQALTKEPSIRYQRGREFETDLRNYLAAQERPFNQSDLAAFMKSLFASDFEQETKRTMPAELPEEPVDWPRATTSHSVPRIRSALLKPKKLTFEGDGDGDPDQPEKTAPVPVSSAAKSHDTDPSTHVPKPPPVDPSAVTAVKPGPPVDLPFETPPEPELPSFKQSRRPSPPAVEDGPSIIANIESEVTHVGRMPAVPEAAPIEEATRVAPVPPSVLQRSNRKKDDNKTGVFNSRRPTQPEGNFPWVPLALLFILASAIVYGGVKWWWPSLRPKGTSRADLNLFAAPGYSALEVQTDPPDAEVVIDGKLAKPGGLQPFSTTHLDADMPHLIVARKAGFQEAMQTIRLRRGEADSVELRLEPLGPVLTIETNPPGADVYFDGRLEGKAGRAIGTVSEGRHVMKVQLDCFKPIEQPVVIAPGEQTMKFNLQPIPGACAIIPAATASSPGTLNIYSTPSARVIIDEKQISRMTPVLAYPLAPGKHTIRLLTDDEAQQFEIVVKPGQAVTKTVLLGGIKRK